ncbi:MAG: hypothetical protein ACYDBV_10855 [Nitrospiria bacterium]
MMGRNMGIVMGFGMTFWIFLIVGIVLLAVWAVQRSRKRRNQQ